MVENVLSKDEQGQDEVKWQIKLSLHYDPGIHVTNGNIKGQSTRIDHRISRQHPAGIHAASN